MLGSPTLPLILLILAGLATTLLINENVVFRKTNEITTTRARWIVTFVQDLAPFEKFLNKLYKDLDKVQSLTEIVRKRYKVPRPGGIGKLFTGVELEIQNLKESHRRILSSFTEYRTLHVTSERRESLKQYQSYRNRRSLLPFVGSALSFLFCTLSDADLKSIKRNVAKLANTQRSILHVLLQHVMLIRAVSVVSRTTLMT